MIHGCPNLLCPQYQNTYLIIKDGSYYRMDDARFIPRFKCKACGKKFSASSRTLECFQKKRRINQPLFKLLSSGVSMRRCALILGINPITVERKLVYLATKARLSQLAFLESLKANPIRKIQFDDLITSEHTKMKPLAVTLAVDTQSRKILNIDVSRIPAFGLLAKKSRMKYGKRENEHRLKLDQFMQNIAPVVHSQALIQSDEHHLYHPVVQKYFPEATHEQFKGGRGCIAGQGELKKLHYDPLFSLNHTCAMLRANINRLFRRTWCTTKKPERLKDHLDIYCQFHNEYLVA